MKRIYKSLLLMAMALLLSLGLKEEAKAADYTLALDDNYVIGNITENGAVDTYTFHIDKASEVKVTYQGWSIKDAYYIVKNYDQTKDYSKKEVYYSSDINPKTDSVSLALEAGTYKIVIDPYSSNTGKYYLKASAEAFENNELEPNNLFETAMELKDGEAVKGLFSKDDEIDFYKISLTQKSKLSLDLVSRVNDMYCTIYDGNYNQIDRYEIYYASPSNPKVVKKSYTWEPGVYYVKMTPYASSYTGTYDIKFTKEVYVSSIDISGKATTVTAGKTLQLSAKVYPENATNKNLSWTSGNASVASVDNTGKVTTYTAGATTIYATAQDDNHVYGCYKIIVTPAKMSKAYLEIPENNKGKKVKRTVDVSWSPQGGYISGYQVQYGLKSNFKGAKTVTVKKGSSWHKKVTKLSSGKTYYFRVRSYLTTGGKTYYGSWGSKSKIKVK